MRKRILIAEAGETVRQAAETVLRQSGYEVISVPSADKAREVLNFARPDLVLVGGALTGSDQKLFYVRLQNDPKTADLPLLIIEPADKSLTDWPGELMIHQPVDPRELLDKIATHVAHKAARAQSVRKEETPLASADVTDAFLDEALGLDKLDVTDSKVFDGTTGVRKNTTPPADLGMGINHADEEELSDSSRVESLIIREDVTDIRNRPAAPKPAVSANATGSLEIMKDQYGLTDPAAFKQVQQQPEADHDYNWFVNSMREENIKPTKPLSESSKLTVTKTSAIVDPVTLGPGATAPASSPKRSEGVEKFIDEFKKEIEQLRSSDTESLPAAQVYGAGSKSDKSLAWEDKLETITAEQVGLFTREFARELGDRIAERLVAKIDPEKLVQMLKEEIVARARKK